VIATGGFFLIALILLASSVQVVRTRDLVRAVLWLAVSLLATAALYALLDAAFLAGVQVLTYVGGVVTLMIFGVMVTRRHEGATHAAGSAGWLRGFLAALALFVVLTVAVLRSHLPATAAEHETTVAALARSLLGQHLLAFELASLLLLAALIGAVVLARRRDVAPGESLEPAGSMLQNLKDAS
jgi:NADH:ubiquinone oxidoreductase subunit 6 (subunit J)